MSRFWLDAARYGDTHGMHLDNYREMWPYRDWVINSFNSNLPFDQFIVKQIAGDLLPKPTRDDLIATGYNRCNVSTNEGGTFAAEAHVRNVIDRVENIGTVYMGLTMGCAVCHDHKFDPVTQTEFYQLFAFLNNIDGPSLDGNVQNTKPFLYVPSNKQQAEHQKITTKKTKLRADQKQRLLTSKPAYNAWLNWQAQLQKSGSNIVTSAPEPQGLRISFSVG